METATMSDNSQKNDNKNKVHLTVITLSGNFDGDFNVHQTLQHVIDRAFEKLSIVPTPNEQWTLRYQNTVLSPGQTIEAANLPDGAVLELAPVEGGGGAWTRR
jgi:hypothetical protein